MSKFSDTMFDIAIVVICIATVLTGGWYIAHAAPQTKEALYTYEEREIKGTPRPDWLNRSMSRNVRILSSRN